MCKEGLGGRGTSQALGACLQTDKINHQLFLKNYEILNIQWLDVTDTRHYQWDLPEVEVSHEAGCPFQFLSLRLFGCVLGDVRLKCLSDIFGAKN